jgi:hypothetical protein
MRSDKCLGPLGATSASFGSIVASALWAYQICLGRLII